MLVTHRINSPYWKMTKNRSGKAERENPAPPSLRAHPLPPCRGLPADAHMMALTRGGVKDSHE